MGDRADDHDRTRGENGCGEGYVILPTAVPSLVMHHTLSKNTEYSIYRRPTLNSIKLLVAPASTGAYQNPRHRPE